MDDNRFDGYTPDSGATQEIDSILNSVGASKHTEAPQEDVREYGITPRERFTELNSSDDTEKTRLMEAVDDGYGREHAAHTASNPVKRRKKKKKKKKQTNHTRTMGQIFLGVLLSVVSICIAIFLSTKMITAMMDFTGMAKPYSEAEIIITEDMNVDDISDLLHKKGMIEMPSLFRTYLRIADEENGFLNGDFIINTNMSYSNIIDVLKTVKTYTQTVTVMIPEGATAQQIGQLLEDNLVCRASDFEMYYKSKLNKYDFEEQIEVSDDRFYYLEGYLFPDTYEFYVIDDLDEKPNMDTLSYAKQAAEKMYANFESKITDEMQARMDELGLTLDETITLASLIQKEGTNEDNMSMISSVFHNRLDDPVGFPMLQSDTTYTYIDNCITPRVPVDSEELYVGIISAYDTYQCEGLPAGPICSPGMVAINAALYPAESDFYYFLASSDAVFYYAQTIEEHEENIEIAELDSDDE